MPSVSDNVLDITLQAIANAKRFDLCSVEPQSYGEATGSFTLGFKTGLSFGSPAERTAGGREIELLAFTDGVVTTSGTATHWAITDTTGSSLIATGELLSNYTVTIGVDFDFPGMIFGAESVVA